MSETIRLSCDCQLRQGEGFVHLCPAHNDLISDLVAGEREACAKLAEAMDYSVTDLGPEAPGKVFSGVTTIDNRGKETPARIAAAIRNRTKAT